MNIKFYGKVSQREPVRDFLSVLEKEDRAIIARCLESVELLGFECPAMEFKQILGALWEIKIRTPRSGYRLFYCMLIKNNHKKHQKMK